MVLSKRYSRRGQSNLEILKSNLSHLSVESAPENEDKQEEPVVLTSAREKEIRNKNKTKGKRGPPVAPLIDGRLLLC